MNEILKYVPIVIFGYAFGDLIPILVSEKEPSTLKVIILVVVLAVTAYKSGKNFIQNNPNRNRKLIATALILGVFGSIIFNYFI